jgi:hypothetical protein
MTTKTKRRTVKPYDRRSPKAEATDRLAVCEAMNRLRPDLTFAPDCVATTGELLSHLARGGLVCKV